MQLWRNKENGRLAISGDDGVVSQTGHIGVVNEQGERDLIDTQEWDEIDEEEFMKGVGELRKRFEVAKKIMEDNMPSVKIMG